MESEEAKAEDLMLEQAREGKIDIEYYDEEKAFWKEILDNTTLDIDRLEKLLKFQREIKSLCESRLQA